MTASLLLYTLAPTTGRIPNGQSEPPRLSETLPNIRIVTDRPDVPGYRRDQFGAGWGPARAGNSTCTTREMMVSKALPGALVLRDCTIKATKGLDPYSGGIMATRSPERKQRIEVDHIYPLAAAWDMGASEWDPSVRVRFANDPLNLVVVTAVENRAKSDALPATWLPTDRWARCWYVRRIAAVAQAYALPLTVDDAVKMRRQCLLERLNGILR
ncbi:HNH endonuclease family protein [Corynebacterium sp. CCM 9204]